MNEEATDKMQKPQTGETLYDVRQEVVACFSSRLREIKLMIQQVRLEEESEYNNNILLFTRSNTQTGAELVSLFAKSKRKSC
jgi:hypothetical protein